MQRYGLPVIQGSAFALPFRDHSFDCIISSEVIEHLDYEEPLFGELWRVLRPGGTLIIGTSDYATLQWRIIEPLYRILAPGGYRDKPITHYTREKLTGILNHYGFVHQHSEYVAGAELVMLWRKPGATESASDAA
jgi:ubiquinone/menaquinone biosynthesis C-methylase UbiE